MLDNIALELGCNTPEQTFNIEDYDGQCLDENPFHKIYTEFTNELNKLKSNYNDMIIYSMDTNKDNTIHNPIPTPNITHHPIHNPNLDIYVLDTLYNSPFNLEEFSIKHIRKIRKLVKDGWKINIFNRSFSKYKPHKEFEDDSVDNLNVYNSGKYNWIFEDNILPGKQISLTSEYNDESGYDITINYKSTCIYYWK